LIGAAKQELQAVLDENTGSEVARKLLGSVKRK